MSVYSVDDKKINKKIYMKDGKPQKVFKDGKLLFPDFLMVNSGGHIQTGNLNCKTTPYGGNLGFNNLFVPYSAEEISTQVSHGTYIYRTKYHTDSVVYGDGCVKSETYHCGPYNVTAMTPNTFPLSSVGDCIIMDGDILRDNISRLNFSSSIFLYSNISADTESISRYVNEHPEYTMDDVDLENSYNPKIKFGICYTTYSPDSNYIADHTITPSMNGTPGMKYYKYRNGCSNMVDIECILDEETNTFYGCTNKYTTIFNPDSNAMDENVSSQFVTSFLEFYDNWGTYDRKNVIITPNYENHSGFIKMKDGTTANLTVNWHISGEFGASYGKNTPQELTICDKLNGDLEIFKGYRYTLTPTNTGTIDHDDYVELTADMTKYPLNQPFVRDFYNYCVDEGIINIYNYKPFTSLSSIPTQYFPSVSEYKDGLVSTVGSPTFINTPEITCEPSTGIMYRMAKNNAPYYIKNHDDEYITEYGTLLEGLGVGGQLTYTSYMRKNNMYLYTEFDARLKFKPSTKKMLPVVLLSDMPITYSAKDGDNVQYHVQPCIYRPGYAGDYILSSYKDFDNLYGDWEVTDEWKHYGYFIKTHVFMDDYARYNSFYYNGFNVSSKEYNYCKGPMIPYLTIWGEGFQISNPENYVVPYEVRDVTTKLYI